MIVVRLNGKMYRNLSTNAQYMQSTQQMVAIVKAFFTFVESFCVHYFIWFPQLYILVLLSLLYAGEKWNSLSLSDIIEVMLIASGST